MDLKKFMAMLLHYTHNMRMLHWKIKGNKFDSYHKLAEEYQEQLTDFTDEVAEMLLASDESVMSLNEAFDMLNDDSEGHYNIIKSDSTIETDNFIETVNIMFNDILKGIKEMLENDDKVKSNPGNRSTLENIYAYIDKEVNYKNKHRKK